MARPEVVWRVDSSSEFTVGIKTVEMTERGGTATFVIRVGGTGVPVECFIPKQEIADRASSGVGYIEEAAVSATSMLADHLETLIGKLREKVLDPERHAIFEELGEGQAKPPAGAGTEPPISN